MTRRLAAVIVHYGEQRRIIRSVLDHWNQGVFSEIIVVANDLAEKPEVLNDLPCQWLIPHRNIGFGAACQLGAMKSSADVCAFFNAHVAMDGISVARCAAAFDSNDVGIAAPYLYYPMGANPKVNWDSARCVRSYSRFVGWPIQVPMTPGRATSAEILGQPIDTDWVSGAALFCRREVVTDVGWDGSYFLSVEDVDISIRAKGSGWRVVTVPTAVAVHSGESTRTSIASAYYQSRNVIWFSRKYRNRRVQCLLTWYRIAILFRIAIADIIKRRRPLHFFAAARGVRDGWLMFPRSTDALPEEPLFDSRGTEHGRRHWGVATD